MRNRNVFLLFLILLSTRLYSQECESFHPNWSPDGKKIIFDGRRGDQQGIFVWDLSGQSTQLVFDRLGRDAHPFWFPDGKRVAFQATRDTAMSFLVDVYAINTDGTNLVKLTNLEGFTGVPSVSPNGKRILFQYKPMQERADFGKNKWHIFVMDRDGKNQQQLTSGDFEYQVPNWSPDGTKIVFFSDRTGNNEIYTMHADGSGIMQLTSHPGDDNAAFFSRDGKFIAFKSTRDGSREIYVMDQDGKNVRKLTTGHDSYGGPGWSPDGKKIAFHSSKSGKPELYFVEVATSEVTKASICDP
jgi:Tol biopolymer transport system component